jgi:hypothetical protein
MVCEEVNVQDCCSEKNEVGQKCVFTVSGRFLPEESTATNFCLWAMSLASARVQSLDITALPAKALVVGLSGTCRVTGSIVLVAAGLAFFAFLNLTYSSIVVVIDRFSGKLDLTLPK